MDLTENILRYFQLKEMPFRMGPDPRFLYYSDQVSEALAKCEYMARERVGPIYIYGPIGSGKTSIMRRLYEKLAQEDRFQTTVLISPNVKSSNAFRRIILDSFSVPTKQAYGQSLQQFEQFLLDQYQ